MASVIMQSELCANMGRNVAQKIRSQNFKSSTKKLKNK